MITKLMGDHGIVFDNLSRTNVVSNSTNNTNSNAISSTNGTTSNNNPRSTRSIIDKAMNDIFSPKPVEEKKSKKPKAEKSSKETKHKVPKDSTNVNPQKTKYGISICDFNSSPKFLQNAFKRDFRKKRNNSPMHKLHTKTNPYF